MANTDDAADAQKRPIPVRRIEMLPSVLANQIAAGEVVDRPSSVVKELLENALDAGAKKIAIELKHAGAVLIRVRDDGVGIVREDLQLAMARHATSKIRSLHELERAASMGFRGEALPSIASVSRFELCSCAQGAHSGWCITSEGGRLTAEPKPAPAHRGTTVSVQDLFFNTPARRKFLRTEKTEFRHAEDIACRIALARTDVAISLRHNGKVVFDFSGGQTDRVLHARMKHVLGREFVDAACPVSREGSGMRLTGWVGPPSLNRAHANAQYFYVNTRMVRDGTVRHAIRRAYQDMLPAGRHPLYVLHLEMDPFDVDVNVHPSKQEVRFREARMVHDLLYRCVRSALQPTGFGHEQGAPAPSQEMQGQGMVARPSTHGYGGSRRYGLSKPVTYASVLDGGARAPAPPPVSNAVAGSVVSTDRDAVLLHGRYLLGTASEILLVERRVAARQLVYHRWVNALRDNDVRMRPLLVPVKRPASAQVEELLEANGELLQKLGLELRSIGPEQLSLRQVPSVLVNLDPAMVLSGIVNGAKQIEEISVARLSLASPAPTVAELLWGLTESASEALFGLDEGRQALPDLYAAWRAGTLYMQCPFFVPLDEAALDALFDAQR